MSNYDVKDLNQAEGGRRRIDWAEREMPVLRSIRERFKKEKPLKGLRLSACLHLITDTSNLMVALEDGGDLDVNGDVVHVPVILEDDIADVTGAGRNNDISSTFFVGYFHVLDWKLYGEIGSSAAVYYL